MKLDTDTVAVDTQFETETLAVLIQLDTLILAVEIWLPMVTFHAPVPGVTVKVPDWETEAVDTQLPIEVDHAPLWETG